MIRQSQRLLFHESDELSPYIHKTIVLNLRTDSYTAGDLRGAELFTQLARSGSFHQDYHEQHADCLGHRSGNVRHCPIGLVRFDNDQALRRWSNSVLESFPDDMREFLQKCITSVEHLEILRILSEDPAREWTEDEVRREAQVSAESIRAHLQELDQGGLLRCRWDVAPVTCRYGAHSDELESRLRRLLELYRQRPVTMIRMVYERPANSLRDFSEAFRLRKKD